MKSSDVHGKPEKLEKFLTEFCVQVPLYTYIYFENM